MKNTLGGFTIIALSALATPTLYAAEFQNQIDFSHQYQKEGGLTFNSSMLGATHFFTPLEYGETPYGEAVFLSRSSAIWVYASYNTATIDSNDQLDSHFYGINYSSRSKENDFTWGASAHYGNSEVSNASIYSVTYDDTSFWAITLQLGQYLNATTHVGLSYNHEQDDNDYATSRSNSVTIFGQKFLPAENGRGTSIKGSIELDGEDYFLTMGGSYYLSQRSSLDAQYGTDGSWNLYDLGVSHYFSPALYLRASTSVSRYNSHTSNPAIKAELGYRF